MRPVFDQNAVMQRKTVHPLPDPDTKVIRILCIFIFQIKNKQNDAQIFSSQATYSDTEHEAHIY
jgi:hypothetical protein